jgi:hypothetical protein
LLKELGYGLQGNRKVEGRATRSDCATQFEYINNLTQVALSAGQPVISVDATKLELVASARNGDAALKPRRGPEKANAASFGDGDLELGRFYGLYDSVGSSGWIGVATDDYSASFAVAAVRRWWFAMGKRARPSARELLIVPDVGGCNGSRVRVWQVELQRLADELDLPVRVSHFPPGTSKWHRVEHHLRSRLTLSWPDQVAVSHEAVIKLIAATMNTRAVKVRAEARAVQYEDKRIKVSESEFATLRIAHDAFHGACNYVIAPRG